MTEARALGIAALVFVVLDMTPLRLAKLLGPLSR